MSKSYGGSGHKRTKGEKELDYLFISNQLSKGATCTDIAILMPKERGYSLSVNQVVNDMKKIMEVWHGERKKLLGKHRDLQLAKLKKMEQVYWEAWERSQQEQVKRISKKGGRIIKAAKPGDKDDVATDYLTETVQRITVTGESKWLTGLQWVWEKQCLLLGVLDQDKKPVLDDSNDTVVMTAPRDIIFTVRGRKDNHDYTEAIEIPTE